MGPAAPRRDRELSRSPPAASALPGMSLLSRERPGSFLSPSPALRTASHPREGLPTAPPHRYGHTHHMTAWAGALIRAGGVCFPEQPVSLSPAGVSLICTAWDIGNIFTKRLPYQLKLFFWLKQYFFCCLKTFRSFGKDQKEPKASLLQCGVRHVWFCLTIQKMVSCIIILGSWTCLAYGHPGGFPLGITQGSWG